MLYVASSIPTQQKLNRAIDAMSTTLSKKGYFEDENQSNTCLPDVNKILKEERDKKILQDKKLKRMRQSEDLEELMSQTSILTSDDWGVDFGVLLDTCMTRLRNQ